MTQDAQEKLIIELIKKYAPKCNDKNSLRVMTLAVNDTVTLQGSEIKRLRDERNGLEDQVLHLNEFNVEAVERIKGLEDKVRELEAKLL